MAEGYNAQAAANDQQIVIAAEITVDSPDFGYLEPILDAARCELRGAGVTDTPEVVSWSPTPAAGTRTRWSGSSPTASRS